MGAPGEGKGIDLTGAAADERPGPQVREPSTIAGMLLLLERALQSLGLDGQRVYALAGLDGPPVNNPLQRIPTAAMGRIMAWAVAETGDPLIGLTFGRVIVPQAFHALGYSLQASRHLLDFGTRLARHFRVVTSGARVRFRVRDAVAALEFDVHPLVPLAAQDAIVVFLVRFVAELSGGACRPSHVELCCPIPADAGSRHRVALGCPIEFDRDVTRICYDRSVAELPFVGASDELARHNDQIVVNYLARLDRADIESRVKVLATRSLAGGKVSKSDIAAQLHMSPRTLQHRLAQCNRTFNDLIDELRRELACAYLEDPRRAVGEVSYLVGFADASNFSRAFKRWTGLTPSLYREGPGGPDSRVAD